nr:reductase [Bosea sp. F3-2]
MQVVSRGATAVPDGCWHIEADARDADGLHAIVGTDTDLLLSCVAFDALDAGCLVHAGRSAGRIVAISSASVYCDNQARTLDEAARGGFPSFSVPLTEQSPTIPPGPETYSTRKRAMEALLLGKSACPVTILRPCAIHGPESKHAREWWFVKRLLDGRAVIPLAYEGRSRFQTTSVAAIADAVVKAVAGDLPEIANVSDADSPSVVEIGRAIMAIMGVKAELVGLSDDPDFPPSHGLTPWSVSQPMIVRGAATSATRYAEAAAPAVHWLVECVTSANWTQILPQLAAYKNAHFDYEKEDLVVITSECIHFP